MTCYRYGSVLYDSGIVDANLEVQRHETIMLAYSRLFHARSVHVVRRPQSQNEQLNVHAKARGKDLQDARKVLEKV